MSRVTQLCERYEYPEELGILLGEIARIARDVFGDLEGIVLTPSVSSGDFLWTRKDGEVRLLSDVDGFVFARATNQQIVRFRQAIALLARGRGGPLFKIDLSINRPSEVGRMPETFQMVETRLAGFELAGAGLLGRFPTRFDPRASRQALLLNLWKPLASDEPGRWEQSTARLLLDIPLLATSEQGVCRPGHRARAEWFLNDRPGRLGASSLLRQAVEVALAARLDPPGDRALLAASLVPAIEETLALIDGGGPPPHEPDAAFVTRLASWLPPRSPRRGLGELRTLLRRPSSPPTDLRWWIRRKEAMGGAALWGLLQIAQCGRSPNQGTAQWLAAYARRSTLDPHAADFVVRALEQYRRGLVELYPSLID